MITIGTRIVVGTFAYSLMKRGETNELVLIDADPVHAEGQKL